MRISYIKVWLFEIDYINYSNELKFLKNDFSAGKISKTEYKRDMEDIKSFLKLNGNGWFIEDVSHAYDNFIDGVRIGSFKTEDILLKEFKKYIKWTMLDENDRFTKLVINSNYSIYEDVNAYVKKGGSYEVKLKWNDEKVIPIELESGLFSQNKEFYVNSNYTDKIYGPFGTIKEMYKKMKTHQMDDVLDR